MLNGARFGEHGNLLLAGHRDSWFLPLQEIASGDEIRLAWYDPRSGSLRERRYTVTLVRVVEPTELTLLAPTAEDTLTLLTCYPFGHQRSSPQRFIVRALPVSQTEVVNVPGKPRWWDQF